MRAKMSGLRANSKVGLKESDFLIFWEDGLMIFQSATAATEKKISQSLADSTAFAISAALKTSVRRIIPVNSRGVGKWTGPAIKCTDAPASRAALAIAKPIFPELLFVRPRTGSIAS